MQHQHFEKIPSTQIYLRDHLEEFTDHQVLISCTEQTNGIGRTGAAWDFYPNSLAMSFLITPHTIPTLTSIEIGILTLAFIKNKFNFNLLLKWPNDLMTADLKKCGGIICNYINEQTIIAGLGVNLTNPTNHYPYQASFVDFNMPFSQKHLSLEIYKYILDNRLHNSDQLITDFNKNCAHLNNTITFHDGKSSRTGIFRGINENGEALLEIGGNISSFLSGSLTLQ